MIQFLLKKCAEHPVRKKRNHLGKFAPVYLLTIAMFMVMFDLTRHLVNDSWPDIAHMYVPGSNDTVLTTVGLLGQIFTWCGFIAMFIAIFWGIDFHRKMRLQWRKIRRGNQVRAAPRATPLLEN